MSSDALHADRWREALGADLPVAVHEGEQRRARVVLHHDGLDHTVLGPAERQQVFEKADGRCHICGGQIDGNWNADHVRPHSDGGAHAVENYLPAHRLCNNYRWDYGAEEFQLILELGVWLRSQIEKQTTVGRVATGPFVRYEQARERRRRPRRIDA